MVRQVQLFLEGRNSELLVHLKALMEKASRELRFEEAARLRDQIRAVESILERQHVVSPKMENQDVVGLAHGDGQFLIVILFIRKGALFENRNILLNDLPTYIKNLNKDGILILSGFYDNDIQSIQEVCEQNMLKLIGTLENNKWVSLKFINL